MEEESKIKAERTETIFSLKSDENQCRVYYVKTNWDLIPDLIICLSYTFHSSVKKTGSIYFYSLQEKSGLLFSD
jgi:hypothetical protein